MTATEDKMRTSPPWYRWPLIVLGLHTAFVGFVFCVLLSDTGQGSYQDPPDSVIFVCIDLPSSLLLIPVQALLERASVLPFKGDFEQTCFFAAFSVVVGGAQYLGLTAFVVWRTRLAAVRRLAAEDKCIHCGYSLTGLPERRCPECGHPF